MSPARHPLTGGMREVGVRRACLAWAADKRIAPQKSDRRIWPWRFGRGLLGWRSRRRRSPHGFEVSLRLLVLLAVVLVATWSRISEMTGGFGTDPNADAVYQNAARWSRIETLGQAGPPQLRNTLDMQLVLIPPGRFIMGSPSGEPWRNGDEWPHRVEIIRPYYLSMHEVTVGQFRQFVEAECYQTECERNSQESTLLSAFANGVIETRRYSWRNPGFSQGEDHPVVGLAWDDAAAFCQWLSGCEGCRYRLPTEAEWEYACRAGSSGAFSLDREGLWLDANVSETPDSDEWTHPGDIDGFRFTAPVGSFPANAFGLHDMHGNAAEWCSDWYGADYYRQSERADPQGPQTGTSHVVRGGAFIFSGSRARSANREEVFGPHISVGFRVLRECEGR